MWRGGISSLPPYFEWKLEELKLGNCKKNDLGYRVLGHVPEAHKTTRLHNRMPQVESRPKLLLKFSGHRFQVLPSCGLQEPPETQPDISWNYLDTPQKHRKRQNSTEQLLEQKIIPGFP